jgi:hypothetical protein
MDDKVLVKMWHAPLLTFGVKDGEVKMLVEIPFDASGIGKGYEKAQAESIVR